MTYDVFISHASEDKATVARPLAELLKARGYRVWLDSFELTVGDSLRERIDQGLSNSRFGVVVLSEKFFQKDWPRRELDGLYARATGGRKVILPVWHGIEQDTVAMYSPSLAGYLAANTVRGLDAVVEELHHAMTRALLPQASSQDHESEEQTNTTSNSISSVNIDQKADSKIKSEHEFGISKFIISLIAIALVVAVLAMVYFRQELNNLIKPLFHRIVAENAGPFTLQPGETKNLPLSLTRTGEVEVMIENLTLNWNGFTGKKGERGQGDLYVRICPSNNINECKEGQIGPLTPLSNKLPAGSGSISIFNFATSPITTFTLRIKRPL